MKAYRANIIYTPSLDDLRTIRQGVIIVDDNGLIVEVSKSIQDRFKDLSVKDFGDCLLIPAFTDLHLHASQSPIRGLGYDRESDWFTGFCYPAEHRYGRIEYARVLNAELVQALWEQGTMCANIMCTTHVESAIDLFEQYVKTGMSAAIGKMNSDYGAFGEALETTEISICETIDLIRRTLGKSELVKPTIAPEFAPACTGQIMKILGELAREHGLIVHSHMCEGNFDNKMVATRFPEEKLYAEVYGKYGLFGQTTTVMAHCISCTDKEINMMAGNSVVLAHCPVAIFNGQLDCPLPVIRKFMDAGVPVGIGSDIGGSHALSIPQNMVAAIHMSKLIPGFEPLTLAEVFHMATKGGGTVFGKVGSFETGYSFDALIIDDSRWNRHIDYTLEERLSRYIYCGDSRDITHRYCAGKEVTKVC